MIDSFLPQWIETNNLSQEPLSCPEATCTVKEIAKMTGLAVEKFTLAARLGDTGIIVEPKRDEFIFQTLPPARTVTLLALIKGYYSFPLITSNGMVMPHGGFCKADWLAGEIEELTEGTKLLFNPSPTEIRIAMQRLKRALMNILDTPNIIETIHGLGYRFRLCPSLITVIISN
jgi:hypothetical protein